MCEDSESDMGGDSEDDANESQEPALQETGFIEVEAAVVLTGTNLVASNEEAEEQLGDPLIEGQVTRKVLQGDVQVSVSDELTISTQDQPGAKLFILESGKLTEYREIVISKADGDGLVYDDVAENEDNIKVTSRLLGRSSCGESGGGSAYMKGAVLVSVAPHSTTTFEIKDGEYQVTGKVLVTCHRKTALDEADLSGIGVGDSHVMAQRSKIMEELALLPQYGYKGTLQVSCSGSGPTFEVCLVKDARELGLGTEVAAAWGMASGYLCVKVSFGPGYTGWA